MATKNSAGAKAAATKAANKAAAAAAAEAEVVTTKAKGKAKAEPAPEPEVKLPKAKAPKAKAEPVEEAETVDDTGAEEVEETHDSATRVHVAEDIRERLRLEGIGVSEKVSKAMLKAFEDSVAGYLAAGTEINFPGFGKFKLSVRDARESRNPRTGDIIQVPAALVPSFKVGRSLKNAAAEAFESMNANAAE